MFVVDDERDVCRSIVLLLRSAGLRGRPFVDPLAFLAAIRPETPGCVVLDVGMPHPSAFEVLQRLGLSVRTVEMHRSRAMTALGVKSAAHMIRLVLAAGSLPSAAG